MPQPAAAMAPNAGYCHTTQWWCQKSKGMPLTAHCGTVANCGIACDIAAVMACVMAMVNSQTNETQETRRPVRASWQVCKTKIRKNGGRERSK